MVAKDTGADLRGLVFMMKEYNERELISRDESTSVYNNCALHDRQTVDKGTKQILQPPLPRQ
jgi:hypothetical protein